MATSRLPPECSLSIERGVNLQSASRDGFVMIVVIFMVMGEKYQTDAGETESVATLFRKAVTGVIPESGFSGSDHLEEIRRSHRGALLEVHFPRRAQDDPRSCHEARNGARSSIPGPVTGISILPNGA